MKAVSNRRACWGALVSLVILSGVLQHAVGQSPETATPSAKSEKKEKLTGRLPAYFAEVVSKEQRTKIYEIQSKYGEQLKKLRDQIEALDLKQQDEVLAVLSAEQRDHVTKKTADAKAKRQKKDGPAPASAPAESGS